MSLQSAMHFVVNASQDKALLGKLREVTGISGDFIPGQISDTQFSAATTFATQSGYDFTPAEIKSTFERLMTPQDSGEQELAESELDLVAGGFASNVAGQKAKAKSPGPIANPIPLPYPNVG
ncbi:MAG: hypothetical protein J0I20_31835 [Chloroflexi bacterium]|nr:hypothetical protein [Chloroflexota bacterium]OJV93233.1 MAG: hypothetical protein BGO39_14820 [Chloroflexi bacterium 54-19]